MFRLAAILLVLTISRCNCAQEIPTISVDELLALLKNNTIDVNNAQICEPPRRCVNHYQCLEDGTFNRRGVTIVNPRFDGEDSNTLRDGNDVYQVPPNNTIMLRSGAEAQVCNYLEVCCGTKPIDKFKINSTNIGCGYSNPDGLYFKINNTNKAQYCEFPWLVALIRNQPLTEKSALVGGGSLIHPNVILTAAHLLADTNGNEFKVRAGEWDTQTTTENLPHQERNVKQIIRHEDYDPLGFLNNYALLVVDQPFVLGINIQPICLPTSNLDFDGEKNCYSAGWGKEKFSIHERRQAIMKKIKLPVVPFELCQDQLRETRLGDIFELHDSFMCAGGIAGMDTCTGDGGSPLMCPVYMQPNRFYQTGIVAWGLNCGDAVPAVYSNVGWAREWIDDKMKQLGFGTASYTTQ